jgi:hypothetical protein
MNTTTEKSAGVTLAELLGDDTGQFTPVAFYDKFMDCIRVELRDCSLTETRVDEYLTILYDNNPEPGQSPSAGLMM